MKYRKLVQRFWEFNKENLIGSTAISLYLLLLNKSVENKNYDFKLSDVSISNELKITRKTVKVIKLKLKDFGLISFETNIGVACNFRIITDYSTRTENKEDKEFKILTRKSKFKKEKLLNDNFQKYVSISEQSKINKKEPPFKESEIIDKTKIIIEKEIDQSIPTLVEFLEYAKSLELYEIDLEFIIIEKYKNWVENEWKNNSNRPISNWKTTLKSIIPYLKNSEQKNIALRPLLPKIKSPNLSNI
jgi:hypothetical protein